MTPAVHTTGINIEGLVATAASVTALVGVIVGFIGRQMSRSINQLREVLEAKLATKQDVSDMQTTVAELRQWKRDQEGRGADEVYSPAD